MSFEDQRFQTYMWRRFDFNDPDASFRGSHKEACGKDSYIGSGDTDHGHRRVKIVKSAAVRKLLSEISTVPKVDYDAIPSDHWTNGSIQGTKQAIEACTTKLRASSTGPGAFKIEDLLKENARSNWSSQGETCLICKNVLGFH